MKGMWKGAIIVGGAMAFGIYTTVESVATEGGLMALVYGAIAFFAGIFVLGGAAE